MMNTIIEEEDVYPPESNPKHEEAVACAKILLDKTYPAELNPWHKEVVACAQTLSRGDYPAELNPWHKEAVACSQTLRGTAYKEYPAELNPWHKEATLRDAEYKAYPAELNPWHKEAVACARTLRGAEYKDYPAELNPWHKEVVACASTSLRSENCPPKVPPRKFISRTTTPDSDSDATSGYFSGNEDSTPKLSELPNSPLPAKTPSDSKATSKRRSTLLVAPEDTFGPPPVKSPEESSSDDTPKLGVTITDLNVEKRSARAPNEGYCIWVDTPTAEPLVGEEVPPTAEPLVEEDSPTAEPLVEEDSPTAEPLVEEDSPTAEPLVEEDSPTAELLVEEDTPTAEPLVEEDSPTAEPLAEEDTRTAEPLVEEDSPTAEPLVEEDSPTAEPLVEEDTPSPTVDDLVEEVPAIASPEEITTIAVEPIVVEPEAPTELPKEAATADSDMSDVQIDIEEATPTVEQAAFEEIAIGDFVMRIEDGRPATASDEKKPSKFQRFWLRVKAAFTCCLRPQPDNE